MKNFIFPVNYIFITELRKIYVREQLLFLLCFPALILFLSRKKKVREKINNRVSEFRKVIDQSSHYIVQKMPAGLQIVRK